MIFSSCWAYHPVLISICQSLRWFQWLHSVLSLRALRALVTSPWMVSLSTMVPSSQRWCRAWLGFSWDKKKCHPCCSSFCITYTMWNTNKTKPPNSSNSWLLLVYTLLKSAKLKVSKNTYTIWIGSTFAEILPCVTKRDSGFHLEGSSCLCQMKYILFLLFVWLKLWRFALIWAYTDPNFYYRSCNPSNNFFADKLPYLSYLCNGKI